MAISDKPVRELLKDFVNDIQLLKRSIIERKKGIRWFEEKYSFAASFTPLFLEKRLYTFVGPSQLSGRMTDSHLYLRRNNRPHRSKFF